MKQALKRIRDNSLVLPVCVGLLRLLRAMGLTRSPRFYSHVPYRGIVKVECGGGRIFRIRSRGHQIENNLYWAGLYGHEPESMRQWSRLASGAGVVLDVGANSGVFALTAAAVGAGTVHAFEPLPRVHAILEGNAALNPGFPLHTWPVAAGSHDGMAKIYDPGGDAPSSASLSSEFALRAFGEIPSAEIVVRSIDSFCREQGITSVDLIKIDVEGYEEFALRGMQEVVATSKPFILMEVLPGQEALLRGVVVGLWGRGYDWCPVDEGAGHVSRNVLLLPRDSQ